MGDPKKQRKKYQTPSHPWQKQRIEEEAVLTREYGFKNKKEIWKLNSLLRNFHKQAKKYVKIKSKQDEKERDQFLKRLQRLGLLGSNTSLDSVLGLELKDILERRLQTLVLRKNLARTISQARQFIVHEHITVDNKKINSPNYMVLKEEEGKITFAVNSNFADPDHPELYVEIKSKKPAAHAAPAAKQGEDMNEDVEAAKSAGKSTVGKEKVEVKEE